MESKTSALKCDRFQGEPYHIYGGEEENIYETIKKRKLPLPETYDEVFQTKPSRNELESQQVCNANCEEALTSVYGECRERKFINQMRKLNKIIPIWVKIAIPIIIICVIAGYNGMLVTELNCLGKVNKSTTHNTSSSATSLSTTSITNKSYSSTVAKVVTTVLEEVTTAKTTWNYTTNKSWYISSDIPNTYYCETWQLISTVKFQALDLQGNTCYTVEDCLKFIDFYKFNSDGKANYTFYIDQAGNIYQGRDWYCPYVSGELWIALLTNSFNMFNPTTYIQLRNFYKMVSYKRAFEYFNEDVEEECVNKCSLSSHTNSNYCVYG